MDNSSFFLKKKTANSYYFGRPLNSVQIIPATGGSGMPDQQKQQNAATASRPQPQPQPQQQQQQQQQQQIVIKKSPLPPPPQPLTPTLRPPVGQLNGAAACAASTASSGFSDPFESLKWKIGLRNASGRYLTAEPFGYKLNVSGSALRQRQTWVAVPDPARECLYFKSHLGRFLSADADGNVACSRDKPGVEERFLVERHGRDARLWALRSLQFGYYLAGEEDRLHCFAKSPAWWTCHLALHPQVHVKNLNRGRYLRLDVDEDDETDAAEAEGDEDAGGGGYSGGRQLLCDRCNPWGPGALITLQQQPDGRVAIRASDGSLLASNGRLVASELSERTLFCLDLRAGPSSGLAFRDSAGRYLTNVGALGLTRTKNSTVGRDELYVLEDSFPQVAVQAFNGRYASIRQGQDLNANQTDIGDTETYQLEFQAGRWRFRTRDDKFWRLSAIGTGISGNGEARDPSTLFEMQPLPRGRVSLRCSNGAYLAAKKLGALNAAAGGESSAGRRPAEEEQFRLVLLNRPVLVFRCGYGFIGVRGSRLECNLATYDMFQLEHSANGYFIKSSDGYWSILGDASISFRSSRPEEFVFEFCNRSCVAILAQNGCYVRGEQNGTVRADSSAITDNCLWEY
ncbi:hypothetical protein BOX15_Mlig020481g1 [Macrostomum lignano]|uniref:Uncharacterized protein n=2 Tax=Macrostomum lignano TaxID=282301 RepID=A0A267EVE6_9PLAT|nr:hypothetical protein BOX15_Mlig007503g1 [Macrostomum lignano]PAA65223.1 hypothetical protein BOX15_Mlig020481g1 [Macrostomum lignano]